MQSGGAADRFRVVTNRRVPEHRPFFACGLHEVELLPRPPFEP